MKLESYKKTETYRTLSEKIKIDTSKTDRPSLGPKFSQVPSRDFKTIDKKKNREKIHKIKKNKTVPERLLLKEEKT